jgi:cytochrome c556
MAREIERVRKLRDRIGKLARMAQGREAFDAKYINPFGR